MLPVYWVPYISFRGPVKYDCGPRVLGSEARGQGRFVPGRFVAGVGSGPNERARRYATSSSDPFWLRWSASLPVRGVFSVVTTETRPIAKQTDTY